MKSKLTTAILVVCLSALIWVFAERKVTKTGRLTVEIKLISTQPDLLVRYLDSQGNPTQLTTQRVTLTMEGPTGRIQSIEQGMHLSVSLDMAKLLPEDPTDTQPQNHTVQIVKDLLNGVLQIKDDFLSVTIAEPPNLDVQVIKLLEKTIPVKIYNHNQTELLKVQTLEPSEIKAYVIENQPTEAHVRLTNEQQLQARKDPVTAKALVTLPLSDRIQSFDVKISLPQQGSTWQEAVIPTPRVGFVFPLSMIGKFNVVIDDLSQLKEPIKFRGSSASAITDYRNSQYHLFLEIHEGDKPPEPIFRRWRYNLPDRNDINITEQNSSLIQFHLVPVQKEDPPPANSI